MTAKRGVVKPGWTFLTRLAAMNPLQSAHYGCRADSGITPLWREIWQMISERGRETHPHRELSRWQNEKSVKGFWNYLAARICGLKATFRYTTS